MTFHVNRRRVRRRLLRPPATEPRAARRDMIRISRRVHRHRAPLHRTIPYRRHRTIPYRRHRDRHRDRHRGGGSPTPSGRSTLACTCIASRHIASRHIASRHIASRHIASRHIASRHIASRHKLSARSGDRNRLDAGSVRSGMRPGMGSGVTSQLESLSPTLLGDTPHGTRRPPLDHRLGNQRHEPIPSAAPQSTSHRTARPPNQSSLRTNLKPEPARPEKLAPATQPPTRPELEPVTRTPPARGAPRTSGHVSRK
jgi:hypothetical protein